MRNCKKRYALTENPKRLLKGTSIKDVVKKSENRRRSRRPAVVLDR